MQKYKSLVTGLIMEPASEEIKEQFEKSKQFVPYRTPVRKTKKNDEHKEGTEEKQEE